MSLATVLSSASTGRWWRRSERSRFGSGGRPWLSTTTRARRVQGDISTVGELSAADLTQPVPRVRAFAEVAVLTALRDCRDRRPRAEPASDQFGPGVLVETV